MKTSTIIIIVVAAVILLPALTGSGGLLSGTSSVLNPNLAASLSAQTNTAYAGDASSVLTTLINNFGS